MLGVPEWAELNVLFGEADMRTESEAAITRLGSVYWYVLEFGACREGGNVKAVGPGLLSSFGEMEHACASGEVEYRRPNFEEMETLPYDVTQYQPVLFVWDSFEEMYEKTKKFISNWGTVNDPRMELHK